MFRILIGLAAATAFGLAQAPTAPVISARGVTNFFTQDPAPGTVAQGGLVQIAGLNLGPPEGATASAVPWPTKLGDVQVVIGGKLAAIYSTSPAMIMAQVAIDANPGLVDVVVRRASGNSTPAKVTITALAPSVRTVKDAGYGPVFGALNGQTLLTPATGLGPTDAKIATGDVGPSDTPAAPKAAMSAYVGGLRTTVTAAASSKRPGEFDVSIPLPKGTRPGDLITLLANRTMANQTTLPGLKDPDVQVVRLQQDTPAIAALTDAGVNGNFLLATGARGTDGCYPAVTVSMETKTLTPVPDCLTSVNATILPAVAPNNSDSIGALVGPPQGDAQSGISATVKIFSAAGDPVAVTLPSPASTLTATPFAFAATLPGTPPQLATIDPVTGDVQTGAAGAGAGPGAGAIATATVSGYKAVYATANIGQNRIAAIAGDDPLKPTKAVFAIVNAAGDVVSSKDFPDGWLPLLAAVVPVRQGQPAAAPPREAAQFDAASRNFYALARATDSSKDAFIAFPIGAGDPQVVAFPDGWFAASCTSDIRLLPLDLVGQVAIAGAKVAETEFQTACAGSGFVTLDLAGATTAAVPLPDAGPLRVPSTRNDNSLAQMNNYIFGVRLDSTRAATTSDTIYVLDGVYGSSFSVPLPKGVKGFIDASVQLMPEVNSLLVQTQDTNPGDQGLVLFNFDLQTATNLTVPDGFTTVAPLGDGATVCCLVTRKIVARALKTGGASLVIYDAFTGEPVVVENPQGVTSFGPIGQAAQAAAGRLMSANSRANTVYAVGYAGQRQAAIIVVRVP